MKKVRGFMMSLIGLMVLVGIGTFVVVNYDWVFSKRIRGEVIAVERVTAPTAVFGTKATEAQMYSYSVLVQGDDGQLYSSSTEDRQWQVVKKGYCVDALLYRYPPWSLDKANTFYNARVENIRICPGQTSLPDSVSPGAPVADPNPSPAKALGQ